MPDQPTAEDVRHAVGRHVPARLAGPVLDVLDTANRIFRGQEGVGSPRLLEAATQLGREVGLTLDPHDEPATPSLPDALAGLVGAVTAFRATSDTGHPGMDAHRSLTLARGDVIINACLVADALCAEGPAIVQFVPQDDLNRLAALVDRVPGVDTSHAQVDSTSVRDITRALTLALDDCDDVVAEGQRAQAALDDLRSQVRRAVAGLAETVDGGRPDDEPF